MVTRLMIAASHSGARKLSLISFDAKNERPLNRVHLFNGQIYNISIKKANTFFKNKTQGRFLNELEMQQPQRKVLIYYAYCNEEE